jgi:hypothetical protein
MLDLPLRLFVSQAQGWFGLGCNMVSGSRMGLPLPSFGFGLFSQLSQCLGPAGLREALAALSLAFHLGAGWAAFSLPLVSFCLQRLQLQAWESRRPIFFYLSVFVLAIAGFNFGWLWVLAQTRGGVGGFFSLQRLQLQAWNSRGGFFFLLRLPLFWLWLGLVWLVVSLGSEKDGARRWLCI